MSRIPRATPPNPAEMSTAGAVSWDPNSPLPPPGSNGEDPRLYPELLRPVFNFVHVQIINVFRMGKVIVPSGGADMESTKALVVSVGPDAKGLRRGDKVLIFPSMSTGEVRYKGMHLSMLYDERFQGVVLEPEEVRQRRLENAFTADSLAEWLAERAAYEG